MTRGKGRKIGGLGLEWPRKADGPISEWWFPWQVVPDLLRNGDGRVYPMFRKSVYARPISKKKLGHRLIDQHVRIHGYYCPGLQELLHRPHSLKPGEFLTVDHIVPLSKGGSWKQSNLRVICDRANRRMNAVIENGKPPPWQWWP